MAATLLGRLAAAIAMPAVVLAAVAGPASPASADPEGGTKTLRAALESAAKGHIVAKQKLEASQPERKVRFIVEEGVVAFGDANLVAVALENLLGNAFKFTQKEDEATIEFGAISQRGGGVVYYVRDDGAGFDPRYADKLFGAFQRLHGPEEFEGTGIGLATVARIVHRHGGRVWAEGKVGEGATFYFTLGGGHRQGAPPPSRKAEVS